MRCTEIRCTKSILFFFHNSWEIIWLKVINSLKAFFTFLIKNSTSHTNPWLRSYLLIYTYIHRKRTIQERYLFKRIREPTKIIHDFALNFEKGHANDFDCKLQSPANHIWFCSFSYSFKYISFSFESTYIYIYIYIYMHTHTHIIQKSKH